MGRHCSIGNTRSRRIAAASFGRREPLHCRVKPYGFKQHIDSGGRRNPFPWKIGITVFAERYYHQNASFVSAFTDNLYH
jgi:hypothetical protein